MVKILMYGWEYPPAISGGLGVACYEIVTKLRDFGHEVRLILPQSSCQQQDSGHSASSESEQQRTHDYFIHTIIQPYLTEQQYQQVKHKYDACSTNSAQDLQAPLFSENASKSLAADNYGDNLLDEVVRYGERAANFATQIEHDVIHAHDWMTILAAVKAKFISNKALILHIHSLEIDRNSEHTIDQNIFAIEKYGLQHATCIIAVSQYTKDRIVKHYGVLAEKVVVIHNGNSFDHADLPIPIVRLRRGGTRKMVLFMGRLTYQKGPLTFIDIAARILTRCPDTEFVVAGQGDMMHKAIEKTARLRIGNRIHFVGFLSREKIQKLYALANVYLMPSISEPFGLSALEALCSGVPAVISNQSGVREVVDIPFSADFWDVEKMANYVINLLIYPVLHRYISLNSKKKVLTISWHKPVEKIVDLYHRLLSDSN
jgi:glycogen(starch) synthase